MRGKSRFRWLSRLQILLRIPDQSVLLALVNAHIHSDLLLDWGALAHGSPQILRFCVIATTTASYFALNKSPVIPFDPKMHSVIENQDNIYSISILQESSHSNENLSEFVILQSDL